MGDSRWHKLPVSNGLEQAIAKRQNAAGFLYDFSLAYLPTLQLLESLDNYRAHTVAGLQAIRDTLEVGILEPVLVNYLTDKNEIRVVDGQGRLQSGAFAKYFPSLIFFDIPKDKELELRIAANALKTPIPTPELALHTDSIYQDLIFASQNDPQDPVIRHALRQATTGGRVTIKGFSKIVGKAPSTVSRYLKFAQQVSKPAQEYVIKEGSHLFSKAVAISDANVPREDQLEILQYLHSVQAPARTSKQVLTSLPWELVQEAGSNYGNIVWPHLEQIAQAQLTKEQSWNAYRILEESMREVKRKKVFHADKEDQEKGLAGAIAASRVESTNTNGGPIKKSRTTSEDTLAIRQKTRKLYDLSRKFVLLAPLNGLSTAAMNFEMPSTSRVFSQEISEGAQRLQEALRKVPDEVSKRAYWRARRKKGLTVEQQIDRLSTREQVEKLPLYSEEMYLVPIEQINGVLPNARKTLDPRRIELLANSMSQHGQIKATLIDSKGQIVYGQTRFNAAKSAESGQEYLLTAQKDVDDLAVKLLQIIEDCSEQDRPPERARAINQLYQLMLEQAQPINREEREEVEQEFLKSASAYTSMEVLEHALDWGRAPLPAQEATKLRVRNYLDAVRVGEYIRQLPEKVAMNPEFQTLTATRFLLAAAYALPTTTMMRQIRDDAATIDDTLRGSQGGMFGVASPPPIKRLYSGMLEQVGFAPMNVASVLETHKGAQQDVTTVSYAILINGAAEKALQAL